MSITEVGYNVHVRRILVLGLAVLAVAAGAARGGEPAGARSTERATAPAAAFAPLERTSAPPPLPCGLPQTQPLWVDYADGMVPFWSTIFARPGIVAAASNF
ncbi:MAG TPA: hypothetical protein VMU73_12210, partial [Gaiellaceae bacterium]|nr:hypothetical protein [Gaiellaceae bacterium]